MAPSLLRSLRIFANVRLLARSTCPRQYSGVVVDEEYKHLRTSVNFVSDNEEHGLYITSYSSQGFKLNTGISVMGPCAIFPRSILHWNVLGPEDINENSLSLFTILEPKLDILVIGAGDYQELRKVDPKLILYLRSKRVPVELLSTEHALSTFNFLSSEKRFVAGAFIPPKYIDSSRSTADGNEMIDPGLLAGTQGDFLWEKRLPGEGENLTDDPEKLPKPKSYTRRKVREDEPRDPDKYQENF